MGGLKISIKTTVKEHFSEHFSQSPFSRQWTRHFPQDPDMETKELLFDNQKLEIREIAQGDVDKCTELYMQVFTAYPWYDGWLSFDQVNFYVRELIQNPLFKGYVIYEGPDVMAACLGHSRTWWMGKEFFIDEFYVKNQSQGNGIGTQLINFVEGDLVKKGYGRLALTTDREIPAEHFYKKNGFKNKENRTVMVKEL